MKEAVTAANWGTIRRLLLYKEENESSHIHNRFIGRPACRMQWNGF
jgi:hypothetical protein